MVAKGLSKFGVETVVTERERGREFRSLGDFSRRVRLGRDDIIALCPAGVFDGISGGLSRTMQARELLKSNAGGRGRKNYLPWNLRQGIPGTVPREF
jgi:DNA polymerase-3 subunit alpha/error-prone DNA polymerase